MQEIQRLATKKDIKKAKFVELWRETNGHVSNCCRAIGMDRTTFYDWLKKDPQFAQNILDAEGELNDEMRDALISKAADGDLGAIIFYLKKRHPDFLDKPQVIQQFNLGNNMQLDIEDSDGNKIE